VPPEESNLVETEAEAERPEDSVVLQVNGVPVLVHPESMLGMNEMASARIFSAGTLVLGADEVSVAQKTDPQAPKESMVVQMEDGSEREVVGSEILAEVPIGK
jgi:hypothetical protein